MPDPSPSPSSQGEPVVIPPGGLTPDVVAQMIDQGILNVFGAETFRVMARSIMDKVEAETAINRWFPATVIADSYDGTVHECSIWLDNAPQEAENVSYAQVLVPLILTPGQRVMIQFAPPHQAYVTGIVTLSVPPGGRVVEMCNTRSFAGIIDFQPIAMSCTEDLAGNLSYDGSSTYTVPQDGIYRMRFSANVTVSGTEQVNVRFISSSVTGDLSPPAQAIVNSSLPLSMVSFRTAMRAGDTVYVGISGFGTGSISFNQLVFEVEYDTLYNAQTGCPCSCGG